MMRTSDRIIRSTHFIAMLMALLLLGTGFYLLAKTGIFVIDSIWQASLLDTMTEGTIVRVLDTIIVLEMVFVVLNLDHKQHINVGMALDVAATITIRELVLAIYSKHHADAILIILLAIAVLVSLRVLYSFSRRRLSHE
jgi:hypothetical protein